MADAESDQINQNEVDQISKSKMNLNEQNSGLEAEDIVADAIKLNVDDDLNEQRYDRLSEKSSSFQNGNQNTLDTANLEDEPNYEVDEEIDEEHEYDYSNERDNSQVKVKEENDQPNHERNDENNQNVETNNSNRNENASKTKVEGTGDIDKTTVDNKKKSDGDKNQETKSNGDNNKSGDTKDDKDSKKDANTKESDSKTAKSKSSSSNKDKSSDHKSSSSSNDKIVWVSGLSTSVRASDLQDLFKKHGKVVAAKIIKNTKLPGSKCFGVITMETVEQAEKCIQTLNKTEYEGKTITVEKNKLIDDKKPSDDKEITSSTKKETAKDANKSSSKRDRSKSRSRSPKRRSFSPVRRFPLHPHHRPGFLPRRGGPPFGFRGGFNGPPRPSFGPPPFLSHGAPIRRMEFMRKREMRAKERQRAEEYRRQRDLERRQHEEREKLEREKMRLKLERERLEREKADFLRIEREKARLERERIEREREELRRKQIQLPSSSSRGLDDSRNRSNLTPKRYDDLYSSSWDDRNKTRFSSSGANASLTSGRPSFDDLETSGNNFTNFSYNLLAPSDLIDTRRKLEPGLSANSRDYDLKRGTDRDDRSRQANGSNSQLGYYHKETSNRSSLSGRDRDTRSRRDDNDNWKSSVDRRSDSRFLDKSSLGLAAQSTSQYLSSTTGRSYDRAPEAWSSAPDRMPPASSLNKFSSFPSVPAMTDRARAPPSLTQSIMSSTIGMYNQSSNNPMSGVLSNPSYSNSNLSSSYRRY